MRGFVDEFQNWLSGGHNAAQDDLVNRNTNMWDAMNPLSRDDLYQQVDAQNLGPSDYENINVDPRYRDAQNQSLQALTNIYNEGGMTAQDRARQLQIEQQQLSRNRGLQDSLLQRAAGQGARGGGQLAAALQGQSMGANEANMQGNNVLSLALQRSMDAAQGMGQMGGQLRSQDYGEQAQKARVRDELARFNLMNQQDQRNINERNRSAAARGAFDSQMGVNQGRSGAYSRQGQHEGNMGQNNMQFWNDVGQGAMRLGGTLIGGPMGGMAAGSLFGGGGTPGLPPGAPQGMIPPTNFYG